MTPRGYSSSARRVSELTPPSATGYGVRGDVRKRHTRNDFPHPDPAVCELIAKAWDEGYDAGQNDEARMVYPDLPRGANPYRGPS